VTARYTSNSTRPIPPPAKLDSEAFKWSSRPVRLLDRFDDRKAG
jgi:hypothetical protein